MSVQVIASAAADEPNTMGRWTWAHPLADVAARTCEHLDLLDRACGQVACVPCWQFVLITDLVFAIENDLPHELEVDPTYIDEVAVERAVRAQVYETYETVPLSELERTEVRRRLSATAARRNLANSFICATAARHEARR